MKKVFKCAACLMLLGTVAVSCQKEDLGDMSITTGENVSVYAVSYSIDGKEYTVTLVGEAAWTEFLNWMLALSEEGHSVVFRLSTNNQVISAKEEIIYTTTNHDDAHAWAKQKVEEGYMVQIAFDAKTGIYTCIAVK